MVKINVLLLIPDSTVKQFGGMGTQAKGIINANHNINFIEHNPEDLNTLMLSEETPNNIFIKQIYNQAVNLPKLNLIKDVDIVHSFDASTSLQGRAIANMLGVPHIMTLHLSMTWLIKNLYKKNSHLIASVEMSCLQMCDVAIHVSKEYLFKYGILNPNSFYMPNGIDLEKWQNTEYQKVNLPGRPNAKKLCYIGRYAEMKNISSIVNASIPDNVDIYFIGSSDGGQDIWFELMNDFVENNPNAYYLGSKYGDEKVNTLKAMDAVIVPSIHEPFGIVCLEALASGCVLLSSFQSGMKEYLTEDVAINCGITPEKITQGIQKWLSLDDIEERKERGFELCKKYSWDNSVNILEDIYKRTLGR